MEGIQITKKEPENINIKNRISKILKYAGNTFMVLTCIILIFIITTSCIIIFNAATHPGKTPSVFGYKTMSVITGSMEPKIKPGDLVIVSNIKDLSSIKVGNIVTYKNKENILITHRVEEINNKEGMITYTMKGDANPVADVEAVAMSQLEGVYKAKIPYLGYVGMFVKTGIGMVSLIIIPMILILGIEIKNYFKKSIIKSA
jgi:signal peptidase